jgi:hypothetical protein
MTGNRTACKAWRRPKGWAAIALVVAALLPFAAHAGGSGDQPVMLSIANEGPGPLRCMVLFAHFVTTDVGTVAPDAEVSISMFRQNSDGALWIARADGRKMMIETIECGAAARWAETRGQVSLLPVRAGHDQRYHSRCRGGSAEFCADPRPAQ